MSVSLNIIVYSSIAGLSTILGIVMVRLNEPLVLRYSHPINSFAAGLLLAISFFHIIPESLELSKSALLFIFLGFLLFYLMENVMVIHSGSEIHFHGKENPQHTKSLVMFVGLFFHSLIDGIIIGVGFEIDPKLGVLASLGVISHELPEGVTTFSLLIQSIKHKTAMKLSLAVALATPLGAVFSLVFVRHLSEPTIGLLLAMAAGSFLYISASDLIPETHEKGFGNAAFLLLGVAFFYLLSKWIGA